MPPLRRSRRAAARSAPYISRGWLWRCRGARRVLRGDGDGEDRPTDEHEATTWVLHDDALAAIFGRLHDGPAVVRCAATCRRWGRVVRSEAASLSRSLPLLGPLALGFFHHHQGRRRATKGPIFVPTTTSAARLLGFPRRSTARSLLDGVHVDLESSRPVASRNGCLVLELRRERRADGLRLCICNPMTGDVDVLPPLSGEDMPGSYACALLTGDDVEPPIFSPTYSRLLLVYNRRGFTALRRYSSDTTSWGPETRAVVRISTGWLRNMAVRATALRGVVYWPLAWHVLGVRLDLDGATMEQHMLSYGCPKPVLVNDSGSFTIGVSTEGRLCLVIMVMLGNMLGVETQTFRDIDPHNQDHTCTAGSCRLERSTVIQLDQFILKSTTDMTSRWYCEKSGVFFFSLGQGSSIRGTFALNLKTKELHKIADRESWASFCGYEMGRDTYLSSLVL